jgi:hypothetical protein
MLREIAAAHQRIALLESAPDREVIRDWMREQGAPEDVRTLDQLAVKYLETEAGKDWLAEQGWNPPRESDEELRARIMARVRPPRAEDLNRVQDEMLRGFAPETSTGEMLDQWAALIGIAPRR